MAEHIASGLYNVSRNPDGVKLLRKYRDVVGPTDEAYMWSICWAMGLPKSEGKLWIQVVRLQVHVSIAVSFKKRRSFVSFPCPKGICTGVVIINPHISTTYKETQL